MIPNFMKISSISLLLIVVITQVYGNPYFIVNRWDEIYTLYDAVSGTPYKNCGGSESVLKSVSVIPCNTQTGDTCVIKRGDNVTFHMSFLSQVNSSSLEAKLYGIYDFFPVPFPCPQPDGCQDSGITCPVVEGQLYNYTLEAKTLPKYPKMSLWIKGELKDDNGKILTCIEIPVKLI